MKDESVYIPGHHGLWRKTKAFGVYSSGKLHKDRKVNADIYVASCIFILRYQEERTGLSPNWDSLFSRVSHSRRSYTPRMLWRQDLSQLDRRAYRILEAILIEEVALKHINPDGTKLLNSNDETRAIEIRNHRRGRVSLVWALRKFHSMLTSESFWVKHCHNPSRAPTRVRAHAYPAP
jgi:hypothetical protein